jgi:hypothetical protein
VLASHRNVGHVDLDAAKESWELLFKYHGRPSGAFGADEMLAGLEAVRGRAFLFTSSHIEYVLTRSI